MKSISRRDFLKGTLAGTASLAAAGILGACADGANGSTEFMTNTTTVGQNQLYHPGTYSSVAAGMGQVKVTMTFDESHITDVVLDVSNETNTIGQAAAESLKQAILAAQSAEIDGVSGATITSTAVSKAAAKCIAQAKGEIPIEIITQKPEVEEGDWLGVEPEISEAEIAETYTTEILVVGCGTGGMFAVATAAEEGADVIGIDRFATGVGIRDDVGGVNSRYQKSHGTKIDKFDYVTMATQYAAGHLSQDLVKLFYDESGETVDWYGDRLAERGVELVHEAPDAEDPARYKHYATGHSPKWVGSDDGNGNMLDGNKVLYDYAISKGARFDYNTTMIKLAKEEGRVTGCIAQNEEGKYVKYIASKGVVIATGGYSMNYTMMEALQPWNLNIIGQNASMPGASGDGIKACLWAGAKMDETHSMMMFDRCALRPDQEPGVETAKSGVNGFFYMASYPWLKVNADGKRFINESGTYEEILHADEYQKGHCHYTIFDSNWMKYLEQLKMHGCARMVPFANGADPNFAAEFFNQVFMPDLINNGFVFETNTIEELAEKLGLPQEQLVKTVKRYNELVENGEDEDYGKESFRLTPVDTAPFYGAKTTGLILCTMDGIQIDANMNAIDTEGNPIPGLYVVGNDSGSFFANTYPNLSTGMACGRTITFGRHVGKYLANV